MPSRYLIREPKPMLPAGRLFLNDNGRCHCGRLECAGSAAFYGGMTLSGHDLHVLTDDELIAYPLACERCGWRPPVATDGIPAAEVRS